MGQLCSADCGAEFWNWTLTLHGDPPDVPACFQATVLVWVPCTFLWLAALPYFAWLRHHRQGYIACSVLSRAKTVLCAILWLLCWAKLFFSLWERSQGQSLPPIFFISPLILGATMLLAAVLGQVERWSGVHSSALLFVFWLLVLVGAITGTRSSVLHAVRLGMLEDPFRDTVFLMYSVLVLVQFILVCLAEKRPLFSTDSDDPNLCPEVGASFISRLTFCWFTRMAVNGYRRGLKMSDLWSLRHKDSCSFVVPHLQAVWRKEQARIAQRSGDAKAAYHVRDKNGHLTKEAAGPGEDRNLISVQLRLPREKSQSGGAGTEGGATGQEPSLIRAMALAFGPRYLVGSVYKLLQDILSFASPLLLSHLIRFVGDNSRPTWHGYALAGLMFLCAIATSMLAHQHFHAGFVTGIRLRSALTGLLYRKALMITQAARLSCAGGELTTLMSVDVQHMADITNNLNFVWSAPLHICLAMYFLWQHLGPSVLAGVAVMLLLIPFNAFIALNIRTLQAQIIKKRDERVRTLSEALSGVRIIKMYAWEGRFRDVILRVREHELAVLGRAAYFSMLSAFTWLCSPFLVALASFGVYVLVDEHHVLDAERAFVSLALFNLLRYPLNQLPQLMSELAMASVSLRRLRNFLSLEELDPHAVDRSPSHLRESCVSIEGGTFTWSWDEPPILHDISLAVPRGCLLAVVGTVGSGKSSLMAALLGELNKLGGSVAVKGQVAYVAQQAWIQNASLRDNVLFGRPLDETWYREVLQACALEQDLLALPAGDNTEIGEKGINLSGGQRQRVSLARAIYSKASVFLLDDPLSAVDAHVGKHIFERVIGPSGLLAGQTRVLVTHGLSFLPHVDRIVVLRAGRVSESGSYSELMLSGEAFSELLRIHGQGDGAGEDSPASQDDGPHVIIDLRSPGPDEVLSTCSNIADMEPVMTEPRRMLMRQISKQSMSEGDGGKRLSMHHISLRQLGSQEASGSGTTQGVSTETRGHKETLPGSTLMQPESMETGHMKLSVVLHYLRAVGAPLSTLALLLFCANYTTMLGTNVWLSEWAGEPVVNGTQRNTGYRLGVYSALGAVQSVLSLVMVLMVFKGCLRAAGSLHLALLDNKLHSPISFYDVTPLGRIINRFSKDVFMIDEVLPPTFLMFLGALCNSIFTILIIVISTPVFVVAAIPLVVIYFFVQRFYVATSRQLKRLESTVRSPVFSHFGESVAGAATLRAFRQEERFVIAGDRAVDALQHTSYPSIVSQRWLAVWLEFLGACVVLFAAMFAVLSRDSLKAGTVGLSVSYAMQVTVVMSWMVRMSSEVESNIVAVERVKEYSETPPEADWEVESCRPPADWPSQGHVEFRDYSTRYREGLDLVLRNISCDIKGGEKVGIVGRTGAGKSSLTLCLLRMVEAASGAIAIDGVDISRIGLHDLRSRITIIPQDPVLFGGSLRDNLDPFGHHSDAEVWEALEFAHLGETARALPGGIQHECAEGGENFSVGQRQLACLARALLRRTRVLVLDEATAAVDVETDALIQGTIRTHFHACTVLTIAHRLHTVLDCTRVMVLSSGQIVEFDSPDVLLSRKDSAFHKMARDAGIV
uniref:ABC-type glutathione-S-conjugate transporter n=1 Tax=Petromyzon marinus TaxID=7757 RepID=A0AAJ7THU8_PETMA|nr:canalicular multispecific organic anion transporter 2-like isoform X1 [Petromyzon marinus]